MILDSPINSIENDQLNRLRFINAIVEEIKSLEKEKSTVIGLSGKWGSGKTSILNLAKNELETNAYFTTYFNPWRYKSEEILLEELFLKILVALNQPNALQSRTTELGKLLKKYSKYISLPKVNLWGMEVDASETAKQFGEFVGDILDKKNSLEATKTQINKILHELAVPLIIFIDDIDRLNKKEIQQLFKLIKLSVDFNNIIYFLAFDETIVAKSLAEEYGNEINDGKRFLEKIVQLPLRIPHVSKKQKFDITLKLLNNWLEIKGIKVSDEDPLMQSFISSFYEFHSNFIFTPRDSKRLINAISFTESSLRNEISIYDIVFIEAIRLYCKPIFEFLVHHTDVFFARKISTHRYDNNDHPYTNEKELLHSILEANQYPSFSIKNSINFLFPYNALYDSNIHSGGIDEFKIHNTNQRIGVRTYLNKYLENKIGEQEISDKEFFILLEKINIENNFQNLIPEFKILESFSKEHIKRKFKLFALKLTEVGAINVAKLYGLNSHFYQKKSLDDLFLNLHHRELIEIISLVKKKQNRLIILSEIVTNNHDFNFVNFLIHKSKEGYKNKFEQVEFQLISEEESLHLQEIMKNNILKKDLIEYINESNGETQFVAYSAFIDYLGLDKFILEIDAYIKDSNENLFRYLKTILNPTYAGMNHVKTYSIMDMKRFASFTRYINENTLRSILQELKPNYFNGDTSLEDISYFDLPFDEQIILSICKYFKNKEKNLEEE